MTTTAQRNKHVQWLQDITAIPTGAGREHRVIAWIDRWLARRPDLVCRRDRYGNMDIRIKGRRSQKPLYFTAHLDHPAFVVTEVDDDGRTLKLEFRGGVNAAYFKDGRIKVHPKLPKGAASQDRPQTLKGKIIKHWKGDRFDEVCVRLARRTDIVQVDDLATWDLPKQRIAHGLLHTPACDDLAAAAAALSAMDILRKRKNIGDVRLLLTRAEEVGFVGTILACEGGKIPKGAKLITLENSRSFPESPIGGGPIVRVGDRISVFHHGLLFAVSEVATGLEQKSINKKKRDKKEQVDTQKSKSESAPDFVWQRKLMPGGACEATAFQAYGYEAICVCLPLGNYHNMGDTTAVFAGTNIKPAKAALECISIADFHNMIELLLTCGASFTRSDKGRGVDGAGAILDKMHKIKAARGDILTERASSL